MKKIITFMMILIALSVISLSSFAGNKSGWKKIPGKASCDASDIQGLKNPKTKKSYIESMNMYSNPCKPLKVVDMKCAGGEMMVKCK